MAASWRERYPGWSLPRIWLWSLVWVLAFVAARVLYRYRCWGVEKLPESGALLYLSNHQSHLDPVLVGIAVRPRPFCSLARKSLFKNPLFAWVIRSLNAVPIERGEADLGAMRQCIELQKQGQCLLVFPEGTRTPDGQVHPFQSGAMLMVRRAKPTVVPIAIEGAYEVWPRGGKPRPFGRVGVMIGDPVPAEEVLAMGENALPELRQRIEQMRQEIRQKMG